MEEQKAPTTGATTEQGQQTATPAEPTAPAAAPAPDWRAAIATVPPDELLRDSRIAGILGERIERDRRAREAALREEAQRNAEAEQDEDLARLLDENEETLNERYPKARLRLQALRQARSEEAMQRRIGESVNEFAVRVGQAYTSLPEWQELTAEHQVRLRAAVERNAHDQALAIGAFSETATDIVAEIRAEKKAQARLAAEIEAAKKAARQEAQAESLSSSPASGLRKPTGLPSRLAQIRAMNPASKEFEEHWKKING